jgi:hypothetical protein
MNKGWPMLEKKFTAIHQLTKKQLSRILNSELKFIHGWRVLCIELKALQATHLCPSKINIFRENPN